jgi:iron complex outermembrane receptor protein
LNGTVRGAFCLGARLLLFRLDANYQGKYRNSPFLDIATHPADNATNPAQAPWEFTAARWILNGRIALRDIKMGPLNGEIAVWGRNLTDNKDVTYLLMFGSQNVNASFQQARTIGADIIVGF